MSATTFANGGNGGSTDTGTAGAGGNASASVVATSTTASSVVGSATANGGNGGVKASTGASGVGGDASASADVIANGGDGQAIAQATGGYGSTAGAANAQASVGNASTGYAQAQSTSQGPGGAVTTKANAPVGGAANAVTAASIGYGPLPLVALAPGQAVAIAELTPGTATFGVAEFSAEYGGSVEPLTYTAEADFSFSTAYDEALMLDFGSSSVSGVGFDSLQFQIGVDGSWSTYTFATLGDADAFFGAGPLALGVVVAGDQTVDFIFSLTASGDPPGFGVTFGLAGTPAHAVPEASTWTMMLLGFAGLGFACWRRARAGAPAALA